MVIVWQNFSHITSISDLEDILPAVGIIFVGTEEPEVGSAEICPHDISQEASHDSRRFGCHASGRSDLYFIISEVGDFQIAQPESSFGMRVVAHAAVSCGGELGEFCSQPGPPCPRPVMKITFRSCSLIARLM